MKKTLLFLVGILMSTLLSAQVLFEESFSGPTFPPSGWMVFGNMQNWASSATNNASGVAPEMHVKGTPSFTGTQRIISPQINTTGNTMVIIRLKHMFDHTDGNSSPITLGVDTRSNNGAWNSVWSVAATTDIAAQTLTIAVSNANVGASNFQFSIYVNGSSANMKEWFIDDVQVVVPLERDAALSMIDVPALFVGNKAVKGSFSNLGEVAINSADVSWQANDGDIFTTSFSGLNITTGNAYNFECADSLVLPSGIYDLKVTVSNVNGLGEDLDPSNDLMIKSISIPTALIAYRPLIESFSSSTCPPCEPFNTNSLNPFVQQNGDNLTMIKYSMNWPGSGDPYYTADGGVRRTYYGVNSVPDLYVDGKKTATNAAALNAAYNLTYGTYTYVDVVSTHEIQGNNVIIDANIVPYANYPNVKVHIAILEELTTGNVGTNGETSFHHVMMKMVPDANGTTANLVSGETLNLKHTVNMSTTFVEEMDDLLVAIFIQDNSTKGIYQSDYSLEVGAATSINIDNNAVNVPINQTFIIDYSQPVRMIGGAAITNSNVAQLINFREDGSTGPLVGFTATINAAKTQIVVTPNPSLKYDQRYYFQSLAVENVTGVPTLPLSRTFSTLLNTGVPVKPVSATKIYPNPANNMLYINDITGIDRADIISVVGNVVMRINNFSTSRGEAGIDISSLPSGMYFIRLSGSEKETTTRFIISR
ncbi:MAG: hypothetical protein FD170_1719 [Bacteroidetes bacterium]|nr:MAG: hypothetical protein FD170_1719 [Bacteroidota bacterium]